MLIGQCQSARVEDATKEFYTQKFRKHHEPVKDLRSNIESAIAGNNSESVAASLMAADATMDAFKMDRQAWNVVFRLSSKQGV